MTGQDKDMLERAAYSLIRSFEVGERAVSEAAQNLELSNEEIEELKTLIQIRMSELKESYGGTDFDSALERAALTARSWREKMISFLSLIQRDA